ncbi:MAG: polysaccharide biosynthesis tyrosine autokinase [Verrucomicrobiota bacterium]
MSELAESNLHFSDYWRVVKNRWPIIVTIFILVVTTAYFYSKSLDKIYASSAVVKVDKENPDISVFQPSFEQFDAIFFQTEFELIQSKKVLYPVIDQLKLWERWAGRYGMPPEILNEKKGMLFQTLSKGTLSVQPYRNTKLIEIIAYSTDPDEAALIANTVAQAYEDYRMNEIRRKSESGLNALQEEVDKQKREVEQADQKVKTLRKELNIDTLGSSRSPQSQTLQDIKLQRKDETLSLARSDALARKVRLDKVKNLTIEELETVLPSLQLEDSTITSLKQNYLASQTFLASLRKEGLGDSHPRMQAAIASTLKYRDQLNKLISGIRTGLEIDLSVAEARVESLMAELELIRQESRQDKSEKQAPYEEALRDLETQQSLLEIILARFKQETVDSNIGVQPVTLVNSAEASTNPVKPNVALNVGLSAVVGIVLGVSLAFFIEYLDTSVKSLDDVEKYLQTTVVGVVPEGVNTLNLEGPDSPNAEAYRILRAKIDLQAKEGGAHTVTVVSGGPGEGKSTTLFNLAYVCAYSGINTLVIDTDFRRHSVNTILGIENEGGLADSLLGYGPIHEYIRNTEIPNLQVITSGKLPPQCMGALSPAKLSEIVAALKPHYDVIFFDSPPILGISDAAVIVHEVDSTLLVIQHRRYPRNISWRAKKVVEEVQGNLAGVVLNKVHLKSDESYYYYTSYYGYYGYYQTGSRREAKNRAKENQRKLKQQQKNISKQEKNDVSQSDQY